MPSVWAGTVAMRVEMLCADKQDERDEFIGSLIMMQLWLMNEKHRLVSLDDRTAEDEAGMEKIDMAYVVCTGLMERDAEVGRMGQKRPTSH